MKIISNLQNLKIKLKYKDHPGSGNNSFFNPKIILKIIGNSTSRDNIRKIYREIQKIIHNTNE